ncbi:hypothetical protein L249_8305 [Ophiocordyceps polyrhachis-furcata BCC 54312]|uniref:Uncharacterized protein n=1 Tax=Ophiocordyceps polyrhachis-furcata BCC 54312 TaxID=1330021 RepID=A0A367LI93_9HYPO|nr:hypothetical protein L249_8305 [Ophiocordyceps polyrhachis-furcata BCC 54312]
MALVTKQLSGHLLVQDLGQDVDADVELASLGKLNVLFAPCLVAALVEHDLGQDLVRKRARHDKGRVAGGASEVDETALGQKDDVAARGHEEAVDLRLDVVDRLGILLEPGHVNLNVEVANDIAASGGGDENLANRGRLFHRRHLVAGDGGLEGVDRIDLSDDDAGAHAVQGHGTALADIAKASHDGHLAGNHDIGGALDAVDQGLAAAVQVVKLGLCDRVIDVDGGYQELLLFEHAVQVVDARRRLLRDAVAVLEHLRVFGVNELRQIASVVENQVETLAVLESNQLLLQAPVVLVLRLALPGEDGHAGGGDGGGSVVLGAEDVTAGPRHIGTESDERLDQDGRLDCHVQTTSDASALERLIIGVLGPSRH